MGKDRVPDPLRIIAIPPEKIRFACTDSLVHPKHNTFGLVLSGDWDKHYVEFQELYVMEAFEEHFLSGKPWAETRFYRRVVSDIKQGKLMWGCMSAEEYDARLLQIDDLFHHIKSQGYKTQEELGTGRNWDEVTVCIGRDGEIMFVDGRHRLAIARVLGLKRIPVNVSVRHQRWYSLSREIRSIVKRSEGGSYQALPHPDLQDLKAQRGEYRYEVIREHLPLTKGRLLDIGANWGYFCHRFEELGFDCVASEVTEERVYVMKRLRDAMGKRFEIEAGSVFDMTMDQPFDAVLALSIFHHFLKEEEMYRQFVDFLHRLKTSYMIFEPHRPNEGQMSGAFMRLGPEEFVAFVAEHTGLKSFSQIGTAENGRKLYLLQRK